MKLDQTSYILHLTSYILHLISDVRCVMFDLWSGGGYHISTRMGGFPMVIWFL